MITLWDTKKLADRLKRNEVTELEKFLSYFLVTLFQSASLVIIPWLWLPKVMGLNLTSHMINLAIWLCAVVLIFMADQARHGKHFVERYFCLIVPLALRFFVIVFFIGFTISALNEWVMGPQYQIPVTVNLINRIIFFGLFYWRLNYWMKYTSEEK